MRLQIPLVLSLWTLVVAPSAMASPSQPSVALLPGAAVSALRGPTGFATDADSRGPALGVAAISVRATLFPDMAVVDQTYTVINDGTPIATTVGIRQTGHPELGDRLAVRAGRPLAVAAWLGGEVLAEDSVVMKLPANAAPKDGAYELGVFAVYPTGASELSVRVIVQTVADTEMDGVRRPRGSGPSRLALQLAYYSWDWSPSQTEAPAVVALVAAGKGASLEGVVAEAWTDGAIKSVDGIWWADSPWAVLTYQADPDARRARSVDELARAARDLLHKPPMGHLSLPADAEPYERPGPKALSDVLDTSRVQRAMIVPALGALLLLLAGLAIRRRVAS